MTSRMESEMHKAPVVRKKSFIMSLTKSYPSRNDTTSAGTLWTAPNSAPTLARRDNAPTKLMFELSLIRPERQMSLFSIIFDTYDCHLSLGRCTAFNRMSDWVCWPILIHTFTFEIIMDTFTYNLQKKKLIPNQT